jgi:hypothetical protein
MSSLPSLVFELSRRIYEAERRINNLIRPARVTQVDAKKGLVKVSYALDEQDKDVESGWIPWSPARAGEINKWEPPSKDEQVIMVNLGGDVGPMSMITSSLWSQKYKQPHDKRAEKKTTVRENKKNPDGTEEPDDNLPAYISQYKANKDDGAVAYKSSRDKYKEPQKQVESITAQDRSIVKATSGGVTNQHTQTANADIYDNPGGQRFVNCAKIAYAKKAGPSDSSGGTNFASAGIPSGDGFDGFSGGATA